MILDWYEKQLETLWRRIQFWFLTRLYPELRRIPDEKHRGWILWYSGGTQCGSGWKRHARLVFLIAIAPLFVIGLCAALLAMTGNHSGWTWVCIIVGGWLAGVIAGMTVLETARRGKAERTNYRAMRIFGYDVCMTCGYDMRGHASANHAARRCPECGEAVPPLQQAA
jgi:hypothetical protein